MRPVFFGCDGPNSTDATFPLLVFIPNADPGNVTNFATSTLQISRANQTTVFDRSYRLASRGYVPGSSDTALEQRDAQWGTCVACAAVERARTCQGHARTSACNSCFARYCFTGGSMPTNDTNGTSESRAAIAQDDAAADTDTTQRLAATDLGTLERNSYIAIGLLGGVVLLLLLLGALLLRGQGRKGYIKVTDRVTDSF